MEKTIEITITGAAGIGKSRITAMIHDMLEREFPRLKVEVNDHDGPKTYATIKGRLEEMKQYPLHPDAVVKISNYIRPRPLTDLIRESTEIATLNLPEQTKPADPYLAGIVARRHDHGLAANDDPENPA